MHPLWRLPFSAFAPTAALMLAVFLAGCGARGFAPVDDRVYGPTPPGFYRVRSGDTLSEIAERKRIKMRQLAAWNDLGPPYPVYAGELLRIKRPKGGGKPRKVVARPTTGGSRPGKTASATTGTKPGSAARASGVAWAWPITGPVVQSYRANDRTRQGVRISAPEGSPVASAADGTVVYSGSSGLAGYGNLIIVKHSPRYLSAYGFNRSVTAREGAKVKRGQQLAEVGRSADGQPMLHFEIRRDGATVDPLLFLPATR